MFTPLRGKPVHHAAGTVSTHVPPQLWSYNSCSAVLGVFNIQGAAWDRSRRRFAVHNRSVPTLGVDVRVSDVELWRDADPGGSWAVYCNADDAVHVVGRDDPVLVELPGMVLSFHGLRGRAIVRRAGQGVFGFVPICFDAKHYALAEQHDTIKKSIRCMPC